MRSLRGQLVFFWLLLLGVCVALAIVMITLYRSSVGVQIATASAAAERALKSGADEDAEMVRLIARVCGVA